MGRFRPVKFGGRYGPAKGSIWARIDSPGKRADMDPQRVDIWARKKKKGPVSGPSRVNL